MRTTIFCVLAAIGVLCQGTLFAAGNKSLTLARDGQPNATIVLSSQPTRAAQLAAYELQWHVKEITGATLPIVKDDQPVTGPRILVGESAVTRVFGFHGKDFSQQEYMITTLPNALLLMGRDKADYGEVDYDLANWQTCFTTWPDFWDEQATLHAVYDFLERACGVRWLNPSETGTVILKTHTLTVTVPEIRRKPFFRYRDACTFLGMSEWYDGANALWHPQSEGMDRLERATHANLRAKYPDEWQYIHAKRAHNRLFLLRMRTGGEKAFVNHSLANYYDRFWEDNPAYPGLFVEKRPELFAKGYPEGDPSQLCYTNPDLIALVAQDARDYFDKGGFSQKPGRALYPGYHWGENFFAVEPMDDSAFCQCDECRKIAHGDAEHTGVFSTGADSDYIFNFVNAIAQEVKKTHPRKRVSTLAYGSHAWPPKTVTLDPSVAVHFCYTANRQVYNVRDNANELAALKAWRERDPDRPLYLWLYNTFPAEIAHGGKFHCFPGFFAHSIGEQFKLFNRYNIQGMFHCGYGQDVEAYITYKLMDDPTLDVDRLLDEYFTGLYGSAAKPLKAFYLEVERAYCNPTNYPAPIAKGEIGSHQTVEHAWRYLGTAQRVAKLGKLMEQAKKLAKTDHEKNNVRLFELGVWEYIRTGRENYVERMTAPIPALTAPRVVPAGGDVSKVDWTKAVELGGPWYDRGKDTPAKRRFAGRIAHDGQYVYLELTDYCVTEKLVTSPYIYPYDDWEVFIAKQRAQPFRQVAFGPTGSLKVGSHGEVNWRQDVPIYDHGITATPEMRPDKWITRLAFPLDTMLPGGLNKGQKLYLNVIRVTSPAVTGGDVGIDTWVSHCSVKEPDRLAEITLE